MRLHTVVSRSPGELAEGERGCLTPTGHLWLNRLPNTQDAEEVINDSGDHSSRTL